MTKITYWGADNVHKNYKGSFEGTPIPFIEFLWTEIVTGGEEELEKRKAEIQKNHERWTKNIEVVDWFDHSKSIPYPSKVKFYKEVRDYQEFEI